MTAETAIPVAPMQRSRGAGTLAVKLSGGRTRIDRLRQSGNARIRVPKTYGGVLESVLINTAGGVTGGDTLNWTVSAAQGTQTVVTTQACERIYRSTGETGRQETAISVGGDAALFWLPQETILFDGGRFCRALDVDLAGTARFVALETLVFGREAMGETVSSGFFHDRWRIRREGRLVHADDVRFDIAGRFDTANTALLGGNRAAATLVAAVPGDGEQLDLLAHDARALLRGAAAGVSRIGERDGGKVVVRLAAPSGHALRRHLLPVLALFLGNNPLPRVWGL
ncbi:MAG: urease accessory protein UreD [Oricola sp.]